MNKATIEIAPFDTLFFGTPGVSNAGQSSSVSQCFPPLPSAIYGFVRNALANALGIDVTDINDKTLQSIQITDISYYTDGKTFYIAPLDIALTQNEDKFNILEYDQPNSKFIPPADDLEPAENYFINNDDFKNYLQSNNSILNNHSEPEKISSFFHIETHTKIKKNKTTGIVEEGMLTRFNTIRLETIRNFSSDEGCFENVNNGLKVNFEYEHNKELSSTGISLNLSFGGERKLVKVDIEKDTTNNDDNKEIVTEFKLILKTPAIFINGNQPNWSDIFKGFDLTQVACITGSPVLISGWDMAKKMPKQRYYAVPAGSVFILKTTKNDLTIAQIKKTISISEQMPNIGLGLFEVAKII